MKRGINIILIFFMFLTIVPSASVLGQGISESSIKLNWQNNPKLKNEGFYKFTKEEVFGGEYYKVETKLALVFDKKSQYYTLIYLNGYGSNLWKSGDIHAVLKPTLNENKYNVDYTKHNKSVNYNWFCEVVGTEIKMYDENRNYLFSYYRTDF